MQCLIAPESPHECRQATLTIPSLCFCYAIIAAILAHPEGPERCVLSDAVQARVSSGDGDDTSTRSLISYGRGRLRLGELSSRLAPALYLDVASSALLETAMLVAIGKVAPENFRFGTLTSEHYA